MTIKANKSNEFLLAGDITDTNQAKKDLEQLSRALVAKLNDVKFIADGHAHMTTKLINENPEIMKPHSLEWRAAMRVFILYNIYKELHVDCIAFFCKLDTMNRSKSMEFEETVKEALHIVAMVADEDTIDVFKDCDKPIKS